MRLKNEMAHISSVESTLSEKGCTENSIYASNTDTNDCDNGQIDSECNIAELSLEGSVTLAVETFSVDQDQQKPPKRRANANSERNSEEKASKTCRRNMTPEPFSSAVLSTPVAVGSNVNEFSLRSALTIGHADKTGTMHDYFSMLPDEIILMIFKDFSKAVLASCARVCRRWTSVAYDNECWTRIELSRRKMAPGTMLHVLSRNPIVLRMSQTEVHTPIFTRVDDSIENFVSRLEYLDLSMASILPQDLQLLLKTCNSLAKLSLENCEVDDSVCKEISKNTNLTVLNMSQCSGLNEAGLKSLLVSCRKLVELNIAWTSLDDAAIKCVCQFLSAKILKLNFSGGAKIMTDSHVSSLVIRCNNLVELDLSDATGITTASIHAICDNLKNVKILSLSRCYNIYPSSYSKLFSLPSLTHLNIFGLFSVRQIENLQKSFNVLINEMTFSFIARPTVGERLSSIWCQRVRDISR